MNLKKSFLITIFVLLGSLGFAQVSLQNTTCEMLSNPMGIDVTKPRFAWQIVSNERNVMQTAYQILVASSPEKLDANEGDFWDSGKVTNSESIHVRYAGKNLKSRTRAYWKVKTWTTKGESAWSAQNLFSVGLVYYKDWPKGWIGFDRAFPWDNVKTDSRLSGRYFRKEFQNTKKIKHATASIIGLGLYELYINGKKVGDDVLAPTPTDYTQNVKYNTYDVTSYLFDGKNAIGAMLGNGRFFAMRQHNKPYKVKSFGFPKMLLNLHIVYTDGSTSNVDTDESWKGTADGPIRSNNEYDGEEYDANKEMIGWNAPGFDDNKWLKAEFVQEPTGTYEAQMNENIKVMSTLKPVSIKKISGNRYILDMGQNMVGWLQLKVKGAKGQKIKLRFAESLQTNGELFTANLRDAKCTDLYTLKGGAQETWEPTFVYRGFRFVELSGYTYQPSVNDFLGKMIYDNIKTIGTFESSDQLTNQIFKNAWWGIAGNYKGIPVDCPQRNERQPWLGDRGTVALGESYLFDNGRFYTKWLQDIRNAQKEDGAIPDVAPAFWRYYSDNMSWPGTLLLTTDMVYQQTGDLNAVRDNYPAMKKWLTYMQDRYMKDYILTKDSYGDWCLPPVTIEAGRGKSADKKYPSELISTAYYYHFTQMMMKFGKLIGKTEDLAEYDELGKNVQKAFNLKFYKGKGQYGANSLTDNILPLYFGIVPEKQVDEVFKNVVHIIEVTNSGHLSTGLVGVQWLMRCLNNYGRPDLAFTIATKKSYPSWGYMVDNGATTIWELWNGNTADPKMNSQNHVMMLGDLLIWYYENLAGIKADKAAFKTIEMKPEIINDLSKIDASFSSPYGLISSKYVKTERQFNWEVTIPPNTTAQVHIPTNAVNKISEKSGSMADLKFIRMEKGRAIYEIGSGSYSFTVN
ncbi:MAG: alpha-rhamnosidase [Pedobacter sp.]|nr:MAG: alpha-rhamnosidase [Pedobacter sp.]